MATLHEDNKRNVCACVCVSQTEKEKRALALISVHLPLELSTPLGLFMFLLPKQRGVDLICIIRKDWLFCGNSVVKCAMS